MNAIFTVNLPIGIIALLLSMLILPGRSAEREQTGLVEEHAEKRRFDILGLILSMVGFTVLAYGITEAGTSGWNDPAVLAYIIGGVAVLVAFVIVELVVSDPVMDIRLFKNYTFSIANFLTWIVMAVLFGGLFLLPLFFENVQNDSALTAGEILIGQGLGVGVGMAISGILYNRAGPRILVISGLILVIAGTYGMTQLSVNTSGQSLQIWLVLRGLGLGSLNTPLQTLALSVVSNRAMARASSLLGVTRQVFAAIGVAVLTTVLTQQAASQALTIRNTLLAGQATHQLSGTAAICARAAGATLNQTILRTCIGQYATTAGLNQTFWIILIACAACVLLALVLGRDPAIEAYKAAKARGEDVKLEREVVMSE